MCSQGGVFGILTSKGRVCQVGGLVVVTSLNWLDFELDIADSKFVKNNLGKHLIV